MIFTPTLANKLSSSGHKNMCTSKAFSVANGLASAPYSICSGRDATAWRSNFSLSKRPSCFTKNWPQPETPWKNRKRGWGKPTSKSSEKRESKKRKNTKNCKNYETGTPLVCLKQVCLRRETATALGHPSFSLVLRFEAAFAISGRATLLVGGVAVLPGLHNVAQSKYNLHFLVAFALELGFQAAEPCSTDCRWKWFSSLDLGELVWIVAKPEKMPKWHVWAVRFKRWQSFQTLVQKSFTTIFITQWIAFVCPRLICKKCWVFMNKSPHHPLQIRVWE